MAGLNVDEGGRLALSDEVGPGYSPLATDVHINGWLVDSLTGRPYYTTQANAGATDVFINGIRHSATGVRYLDVGVNANAWPEGLTVGDDGRLGVVDTGPGLFFIRGQGRNAAGSMNVALGEG